jgi:hypothetical protein
VVFTFDDLATVKDSKGSKDTNIDLPLLECSIFNLLFGAHCDDNVNMMNQELRRHCQHDESRIVTNAIIVPGRSTGTPWRSVPANAASGIAREGIRHVDSNGTALTYDSNRLLSGTTRKSRFCLVREVTTFVTLRSLMIFRVFAEAVLTEWDRRIFTAFCCISVLAKI